MVQKRQPVAERQRSITVTLNGGSAKDVRSDILFTLVHEGLDPSHLFLREALRSLTTTEVIQLAQRVHGEMYTRMRKGAAIERNITLRRPVRSWDDARIIPINNVCRHGDRSDRCRVCLGEW